MQNLSRYQKQYLFKLLGKEGQKKICTSRVLVAGSGALGSLIAETLARAGVGFLRIIDRDIVELDNLHRQVLFDESDAKAALPKAVAAARRLRAINSSVAIEPMVADIEFTNIEGFVRDVDLVMDGTDNFETRYLLNEVCVKLGKTWIYAGCVGSEGMTMTVIPGKTPCLRCVFESAPAVEVRQTCDTAGILAPAAFIAASFASTEALKLLGGNDKAVSRDLFRFDVWSRRSQSLSVQGLVRTSDCPVCAQRKFDRLSGKHVSRAVVLCGRNAVQITAKEAGVRKFRELSARLKKAGKVTFNDFVLRVDLKKYVMTVFFDGRTIVRGTSDIARAKSIYARYIGS